MHVNKTFKKPTELQLIISATAEDLHPIKQHVLSHFARKVKVPGFRAGKAPLSVIEKNADPKALMDDFLEHAVNQLYEKAIALEKVRPVANPQVSIKKFVPYTSLEFEVITEVIGEVKLPDYKKIKVAKTPVSVSAKEVTDVIDNIRKQGAERSEVERAAKNGDEITIDFAGKDKTDKAVDGADGKDYPLIIGSKTFIPGFEEELIGLKKDQEKEFNINFPNDYGVAALQGEKVIFTVKVKKIAELNEPKADDKFASSVGPFKTLNELKSDVKKQLIADKQKQAEQAYANEVVQKLAEKTEVEIPDTLIDSQIERMEDEERRNLVYRGQTWQEHLEVEGVTDEQHKERMRPDAKMRVVAGLALSEVADKEQISVEKVELDLRIEALKGQYQDPKTQAELEKPEVQQDIAMQLLTEKTVAKLVDYASK
jgi:trigger factor